jgi:hypothetical protein
MVNILFELSYQFENHFQIDLKTKAPVLTEASSSIRLNSYSTNSSKAACKFSEINSAE